MKIKKGGSKVHFNGGIQKKEDVRKSGLLGKTEIWGASNSSVNSLHDAKLSEVLPLFICNEWTQLWPTSPFLKCNAKGILCLCSYFF